MNFIIDTNTVNYIVKRITPAAERFEQAILAGSTFHQSQIVHYEVMRYFKLRNMSNLQRYYESLRTNWMPVTFEPDDWDSAADLWANRHRAGKPIEDADLLIAVETLKTQSILVTNNERHFDGLGLTVENWTK